MIKDYLRKNISQTIEQNFGLKVDPSEIGLEKPKQEDHGDWSTNIAMNLSKSLKDNPRKLADKITASLKLDHELVNKVEVAGPGFINFKLAPGWLYSELMTLLDKGSDFGKNIYGQGKKAQVEFVSCNPTGPITVGHGRQAVIGDVLSRLLEAIGYQVLREYYFNDGGLQMQILSRSVYLRYRELLGEEAKFPEDHYQGDYIREIAEICLKEKGQNLSENDFDYFKKVAVEYCFGDIKKTMERLGIFFDVYFNESALYKSGEVDKTVADLKATKYTYEKDGALWFKATEFGAEKDRVLVRSSADKVPTYRVPDIAYHRNKFERGFDLILDVFGADHQATYPDVMAALKALGYDTSKMEVRIHQFVTLTSQGQQIKMSTRKANYVTLDELMDDVGPDVVRYFFLMRRMEAHLDFDIELARKHSDENPVFYVQYAHARICSIIDHAREKGVTRRKSDLALLKEKEEINLIKALLEFPEVVLGAALAREPHRLPTYLQDLAGVFHNFYHLHRVVTDDAGLTQARLDLCDAARIVFANGLNLLGVSAPEKM